MRVTRYSFKRIVLFGSVYILLGISNLLIKLVSFKRLVRLFSNSDTAVQPVLTPRQVSRLKSVKRAITSASRRTPWRSNCFEQAITASLILKVLGISHQISFGLNTDNNVLKAHAWLLVKDMYVTGYIAGLEFTAVSVFYYTSRKDRMRYV
jgi:hypothetical protein